MAALGADKSPVNTSFGDVLEQVLPLYRKVRSPLCPNCIPPAIEEEDLAKVIVHEMNLIHYSRLNINIRGRAVANIN